MIMEQEAGIFEIINNEGAICYVDTKTEGKVTFGPTWASICESSKSNSLLEATIDRPQYRMGNGTNPDDIPTGLVVKIRGEVEAFLPGSLSTVKYNEDMVGKRIAVMIESFDPLSRSIIVREVRVMDSEFNIDDVNNALEQVGIASIEKKYVRGTIMGEKINHAKKRRSGFLVSINGLEAFLPCNLTFFPYLSDIDEIIGHNVLTSVEAISLEKMSVVLSMVDPYDNLIRDLSRPALKKDTKGIIYWVNGQSANVLLPGNVHGKIPMGLYQTRGYHDWLDLTGSVISCIPYKKVEWDKATRNYQYQLALS